MFKLHIGENGSSLIDVLMANFLLIIGVFGILSPLSIGMHHLNDADRTSIAMNLARSKMEEVMLEDYSDLVAGEWL